MISWSPLRGLIALTALLVCMPIPSSGQEPQAAPSLSIARQGFQTKLTKKELEKTPPSAPPEKLFQLIRYQSPAGDLAAYLSPAPGDGKKHPLVIWLVGGFGNSISELAWEEDSPMENDQSASAYRKAGIAMMYPSLRGGNDNPGFKEGLFGEVDDVLAAAKYAASLPWVDSSRIYLGGHSTGGTLALLAAEAAPRGLFRAVLSFGPVEEVAAYGQAVLPFNIKNEKERKLRAPVEFLDSISARTFVMEGKDGNSEAAEALRQRNKNEKISFFLVSGEDHFTILGPTNALLAKKILADTGADCAIRINGAEIRRHCREARENNFQPAGDLQTKGGAIGLVFYYTPEPAVPPVETWKTVVAEQMKGVPVVASFEDAPEPPFILLREEKAPLEDYPVPDDHYFTHAGRGLSKGDIAAIQKTKLATIAVLFSPKDRVWKDAKTFNRMALEYAEKTKAFIWDSATRECFHRDAWKKTRIDQWGDGELPDIRSQITVHFYEHGDEGYRRAITLGMEKFGLPDVAIEQLAISDHHAAGALINSFCQTIAANPKVEHPRAFTLAIDALVPASVRTSYQKAFKEKAEGKATLAVMRGTPDQGDPENAQIALDFRHGKGSSNDERRSDILARLWGATDEVTPVVHDEDIKKTSAQAKVKLLALKEKFRAGMEPGNRLLVKGPFDRDDAGKEWMWIEVMKWGDDDILTGTLQNDPHYIKDLRQGSKVTIKMVDAFDYILDKPDGTTEGNETGALMLKQQEEKEKSK